MATKEELLRGVSAAARRAEEAHGSLVQEMRRARDEGISLRAIAEAAGRSHESVRKLLEG